MIDEDCESSSSNQKWYQRKIFPGLYKIDSLPENFWKFDIHDWELLKTLAKIEVVIYILSLLTGSFFGVLAYWDGPMFVYVARTFYNIPREGPDSHLFKRPPEYFTCHFPGYPIIIRIFSTIVFNRYWLGLLLSIIFGAVLVTYLFRRLLIVYDCVQDPNFTTYISLYFPLRFVLYKAVGACEPLYMSYCFLAFIFFKTDQIFFLLLSLWGACLTRIEGLSIVGTIGLSYLLRLDIPRALFTGLGFLATPGLFYFYSLKFGIYTSYFEFNDHLLNPFYYSLRVKATDYFFVLDPHTLLTVSAPMLAGTLVLYVTAVPMAIFSTVYLLFISFLNHEDIMRYSMPGYVLAVLIGFDSMITSPVLRLRLKIVAKFLLVVQFYSYIGQMNINRANDLHFKKICDIIHHVYEGPNSEVF